MTRVQEVAGITIPTARQEEGRTMGNRMVLVDVTTENLFLVNTTGLNMPMLRSMTRDPIFLGHPVDRNSKNLNRLEDRVIGKCTCIIQALVVHHLLLPSGIGTGIGIEVGQSSGIETERRITEKGICTVKYHLMTMIPV